MALCGAILFRPKLDTGSPRKGASSKDSSSSVLPCLKRFRAALGPFPDTSLRGRRVGTTSCVDDGMLTKP